MNSLSNDSLSTLSKSPQASGPHRPKGSGEPRFVALLLDEEELDALVPLIGGVKKPEDLTPAGRVALRIVAAAVCPPGECMVCECTDDDCSQCIARTGEPCAWVNSSRTLCSACLA